MPIYEYKCQKCGDVYEVRQSFSDDPLTQHEGCGGSVERLISAPALQFKGSGWYITDYAKSNSGSAANGGKTPGTETKTEAKSESKSDSKSSTESKSSASSTDKK
jgi:putative FmdB family regulatory protein